MIDPFRKRLTASTFVRRAYAALRILTGDEFRMRSVLGSKPLIEEVMPLAALVKHLETPERRVSCRWCGDDAEYDAELWLSGPEVEHGFLKPRYFVEVTQAVPQTDFLKREALTRNGSVFGGEDIRRVGSRARGDDHIVSRPVAMDGDATVKGVVTLVRQRLVAKAAKNYPAPCLLAINVEPEGRLSLAEWARVVAELDDAIDAKRFALAYLVQWSTNSVFGVYVG